MTKEQNIQKTHWFKSALIRRLTKLGGAIAAAIQNLSISGDGLASQKLFSRGRHSRSYAE
jgi:hypothetical protein